jgi:hypothetical protein
MTNKDITREAIFVLTSYIISTTTLSIITFSKKMYLNDIFVSVQDTTTNWYDFIFNIDFKFGLLFFFPTLFVVNLCRQVYFKMQLRHLNIFQLFVTFVSFIITIVLTTLLNQLSDLMADSYTLYPPLSAIPQVETNSIYTKQWVYIALAFCLLQLTVFTWTIIKTYKTKDKH